MTSIFSRVMGVKTLSICSREYRSKQKIPLPRSFAGKTVRKTGQKLKGNVK